VKVRPTSHTKATYLPWRIFFLALVQVLQAAPIPLIEPNPIICKHKSRACTSSQLWVSESSHAMRSKVEQNIESSCTTILSVLQALIQHLSTRIILKNLQMQDKDKNNTHYYNITKADKTLPLEVEA
jgi:hypothetical protein